MNDLEAQVLIQLRSIARWQSMVYTNSSISSVGDIDKACNSPEVDELIARNSISFEACDQGNLLSAFFTEDAFDFLISLSASPHWLWLLVAGAARNRLPITRVDVEKSVAAQRQDLLCAVSTFANQRSDLGVSEVADLIGAGAIVLLDNKLLPYEPNMVVNPIIKDNFMFESNMLESNLPLSSVQINLVPT